MKHDNPLARLPRPSRRWLATLLIGNGLIWTLVLAVTLLTPRSYTSSWTLILPGSEMEARVSMQDVGQASASSRSFYDGRALDHRVNYREIARSAPVLASAGEELGLSWKELRDLQVRLVDQSSIMEFESRAATPEEARDFGWAMYRALQRRLSELREDELEERKRGVERAVREAQGKMEAALDGLAEFKKESGLVSAEQVEGVVRTALELESLHIQTRARLALAEARLRALSLGLGLTPEEAAEALILLSDRSYSEALGRYNDASSALAENARRWGPRHPARRALDLRLEASLARLVERAARLLDRPVAADEIDQLNFLVGPREATSMFDTLSEALADSRALSAEARELERRQAEMKAQLVALGRQQSLLENLERRLALTEAIFNSTLGKADVGRLSLFASYPLIQLLAEPGLPDVASSPKPLLLVLGGCAASGGVTVALLLLWIGAPEARRRVERWTSADARRWEEAA